MLISLVLILFIALSAVSAADDVATEDVELTSVDEVQVADDTPTIDETYVESNDVVQTDTGDSSDYDVTSEEEVISDSTGLQDNSDNGGDDYEEAVVSNDANPKNALKAEPLRADGDGTFTELYDLIKNGGTVTLNKNYAYNAATDSALVNGMTIAADLTINGNGHTIDGAGVARMFILEGYTTTSAWVITNWHGYTYTFNNLNFINANSSTLGGVITSQDYPNTIRISNCNFTNNQGYRGSALYVSVQSGLTVDDGSVTITGCIFKDNYASNNGGAIYSGISNGHSSITVSNSVFVNNTSPGAAKAIYYVNNYAPSVNYNWWGQNGWNNNFVANSASNYQTPTYRYQASISQTGSNTAKVTLALNGGTAPSGSTLPAREASFTIGAGAIESTGPLTADFVATQDTVITATVDNQPLTLNVYKSPKWDINELTISVADVTLLGQAEVIVDSDVSTTFNVTIQGVTKPITLTDGHGTMTWDLLPAGDYYAFVSCVEDPIYNDKITYTAFSVKKADVALSIEAEVDEIEYGDITTIIPTIAPDSLLSQIKYYVDGNEVSSPVLRDLPIGTHTVVAKYAGDDTYNSAESNALTITVKKSNPEIMVQVVDATYPNDARIDIWVIDGDEEPIEGITVKVTIDNVDYVGVTDQNGDVSITTRNLGAGTHPITVVTLANEKYNAAAYDEDITVTINKGTSTVTSADVTVIYPDAGQVSITASVPGAYSVKVGNDVYTANVVSAGGTATVDIPTLAVGEYDISVSADLGNNYNPVETGVINTYTVSAGTIVVTGEGATVLYPNNATIRVSTNIAGTYTIRIDGRTYDVELAVGENEVYVPYILNPGDYPVFISADISGYGKITNKEIATYKVSKGIIHVSATGATVAYPEKGSIVITTDVIGDYRITIGDKNYDVHLSIGENTFEIPDNIAGGVNPISIYAAESNLYETLNAQNIASYVVEKAQSTIALVPLDITYGEDAVVTFKLEGVNGEKLNGTIMTYVDNKRNNLTVTNGEASITFSDLSAGLHIVYSYFLGNDYYEPTEMHDNFTIAKADITVGVHDVVVTYPEKGSIILTASLPGTYTVKVGNVEYTAVIIAAGASSIIPITDDLVAGTYDISVTARETSNYNAVNAQNIATYTINKADLTITVTPNATSISYDETIGLDYVIDAPTDATAGTVTYYVDGEAWSGNVLSGLSVGSHDVVAKYAGDPNYNDAQSVPVSITVTQAVPIIRVVGDKVTYPDNATIYLTVENTNHDPIGNLNIDVIVNGVHHPLVTNEGGLASLTIEGLNAGDYPISVVTEATDGYESATYSGDAKVVVDKLNATISFAGDFSVTYPESGTIIFTASEVGTYTIHIGNEAIDVEITEKNQIEVVSVKTLDAGSYDVSVTADLGPNYNPLNTGNIAVYTVSDGTIAVTADNVTVAYPVYESFKIYTNANGTYTISVGSFTETKTLSQGDNYVYVRGLGVGTYDIIVSADIPNYGLVEELKIGTFTVVPGNVSMYCDNESVYYPSMAMIRFFSNADGEYTVSIAGKDYNLDIESGKGYIYSDTWIPVGEYDVIVSADLGPNYNPVSGKIGTYTVEKNPIEITVVPNATSIPFGEEISLNYTLRYEFSLDEDYLTYVFDGEDIVGNVVTADKLTTGTHTVAVKYIGDPNVEDTVSAPVTITVGKESPIITVVGSDVTYPKNATVMVTVTNAKGDYLEGIALNVTVNDVDYALVTNVVGTATLTIQGLDAGEYPISVVSLPNDYYGAGTYTGNEKVIINKDTPTVSIAGDVTVSYPATGTFTFTASEPGIYTIHVGTEAVDVAIAEKGQTVSVPFTKVLDVGSYDVTVTADIGKNFNPINTDKLATYIVGKGDVAVSSPQEIWRAKYPGRSNVTLTTNVTGIYNIIFSRFGGSDSIVYENVELTAGDNVFEVPDVLDADDFKIYLDIQNDNYNPIPHEEVTLYSVELGSLNVKVEDVLIDYPNKGTFTFKTDVAGTYTIEIYPNLFRKDFEFVAGENNFTVDVVLPVGSYTVLLTTHLSPNYKSYTNDRIAYYHVFKGDLDIALSSNATTIAYGEEIKLSNTVTPPEGTVASGTVTYYVDGRAVTGDVVSGLSIGTHTVVAKYTDDPSFKDKESDPITITVNKATPVITVVGSDVTYPKNATVMVTVTNANGDYLEGVALNVTVNDVDYALVTNVVGTATLTIQGLDAGEYPISVVSVPNDDYGAGTYTGNEKVKINKITATVSIADDVAVTYPETGTITFTASDVGTYTINIGSEQIPVLITERDQTVSVPVKTLDAGVYDVSVSADLGKNYNPVDTGNIATYTVMNGALVVTSEDFIVEYPGYKTITINTNVEGNYTIRIGDNTYRVKLYKGGTSINVGDFVTGTYDILVSANIPNYDALEDVRIGAYTVVPATVRISCPNVTAYWPDFSRFEIQASVDGAYVITINGRGYEVDVLHGHGTVFPTGGIPADVYDITISADLGPYYNPVSGKIGTYTVEKSPLDITVVPNATSISFGDEISLDYTINYEMTLEEDYLTYIFDGEDIAGNVVTADKLTTGTHTVAVKYIGDPNVEDAVSAPVTITVGKSAPLIEVTSIDSTYPKDAGVAIVVKSPAGVPLSGITVRVNVGGTEYAIVTDNTGQGIVTVKGLNAGKYPITAVSVETDDYVSATNGTENLTIAKASDAIVDVELVGNNIVVTFTSNNGTPLDGTVNVAIDGGEAVPVTVSNGQGTLDARSLTAGEHTVTATSVADVNYDSATVTKTIDKDIAPDEAIIVVNAENIVYGQAAEVTVSFTDSEGNPLQGTLSVKIGETTKPVEIGADGTGSVSFEGLDAGHYTAVVSFAGDETYKPTSSEYAFNVSKAQTSILSEDIVVTANVGQTMEFTLKDLNGNILAGKTITMTFNGQSFERTSDAEGKFTVEINMANQGTYTISASYAGEDNYEASSASYNVVVRPIATKLTVSDVTYGLSETKYLTATLTAGDEPLANKIVTFSLNGKTYTGRTNADGVVRIAVSLTAKKTYSVVASYGGDTTYGSAMAIYKLKVVKS